MATSGSNYYSPDGGTLRLVLNWSRIETDVANNRSKIRLTLQLRHGGTGVWFSARKNGVLHGQSFTYSGGFSNTGTVTLRTRELWVNHNSDGTKSITFNAKFDIAITYRGSWLGSMSTSVTANIDRIPRASSINSFSIANHLKPSTSNTVNLSLSRATSSFTHDIELRDGSTVIQSWTGQGTPTTLSLSSSSVNTLLDRMRSVTSRRLTLRVQTKSGSSVIGTTTRNATTYVDSSVRPSVSGLTHSQVGNNVSTHYLQNISKIKASFSASANGGASLSNQSITVKNGSDNQVINGSSGTTANPITNSGTYEVIATATDSRGRTSTQTSTFTSTHYSQPRISRFEVNRDTGNPALVKVYATGNFISLDNNNKLDIQLERKSRSDATWESVYSVIHEDSSFQKNLTIPNNDVSQSYEYRLILTDSFNNRSESSQTIATQRVVLDIHKNEGVGIGKIHERGVLDVDGTAYFNGDIALTPKPAESGRVAQALHIKQPKGTGSEIHFEREGEGTTARLGHFYSDNRNFGFLNTTGVVSFNANDFWFFGSDLKIAANNSPMTSVIGSGSNANGEWVKFYDGTMICWSSKVTLTYNTSLRLSTTWNLPATFSSGEDTALILTRDAFHGSNYYLYSIVTGGVNGSGSTALLRAYNSSNTYSSGNSIAVSAIAIGRWK